MQTIILSAERIIHQLKSSFLSRENEIGNYYFKESIISDSHFKIIFTDNIATITPSLGVHPLDMPWKIDISIIQNNEKVNFNDLMLNRQSTVYDVYPNLLNDPNGLGNELAKQVASDLMNFLKTDSS